MSPPTLGSSILMISAPRSARTCVPNGPAPNCDTVRMRTPSSGARDMSVRELAFAERRGVLPRHQHLSRVRADGVAALIGPDGLDAHHATIALARGDQLEHRAPRVERVPDEGGL